MELHGNPTDLQHCATTDNGNQTVLLPGVNVGNG